MSDIKPIDLPTAAGVEFGRGDVRHFSENDAVNVVGLQNPTRHLAERDNLLAEKVNELVTEVNNKEQFVPLSVPRTAIAPGTEEVVTNFAIPEGFEARVINATIGSTPISSDISLKIYFASGYGNVTGTELVSTTSTFTSGVAFYNAGEFIVALRNNGATTLEVVASITLTVRPIGSTASLLVGSVIQGKQGLPGGRGDRGLKGDPGTGGAGSPGMVWSGAFNAASSYAPPQAVSYTNAGVTQSYICKLNNPGPGAQPPTNTTYWDLLVSAGSSGVGMVWQGAWSGVASYDPLDAVSYTSGLTTSSYICTASVSSATPPPSDLAHWDIMTAATAGGGETPTYSVTDVSALLSYSAAPVQLFPADGLYYRYAGTSWAPAGGIPLPVNSFREFAVTNTSGSPRGVVFLYGQMFINLAANGYITFTMPVSPNTHNSWLDSEINFGVASHGAIPCYGTVNTALDVATNALNVKVFNPSSTQYQVINSAGTSVLVDLSIFGMKSV